MGDNTSIEWTDATWNPVIGCSRVSTGCDHCYAIGVVLRGLSPQHAGLAIKPEGGRIDWTGEVRPAGDRKLTEPLRWTKPRRIFVNSLSDLFHPDLPEDEIAKVFAVMALAPQHTFQVLTKRPQRMAKLLAGEQFGAMVGSEILARSPSKEATDVAWRWPLPNVHLGVSIENDTYTWRADHLRNTPAAVRFISAEPLLGPLPSLDLTGIDWLIVGGESGPGARPMHPDWVRDFRDRCHPIEHPCAAACHGCGAGPDEACFRPCRCDEGEDCWAAKRPAFLFKQWGDWLPYEPDAQAPFWNGQAPGHEMLDGHTLPADLTSGGVHAGWLGDLGDPGQALAIYRRIGKKAAGRHLDGRTWDQFPAGARS